MRIYDDMVDSGVDWLGLIPSSWGLLNASVLFNFAKGTNAQKLTNEYIGENPGDYPVYSGQTSNGGIIGTYRDYEFNENNGVILVTTVGAKAMTSRYIKGRFSLSQNCLIMRPKDRYNDVSVKYYSYVTVPLFTKERALIPDHMQPSMRMSDLAAYRLPLPRSEVQQKIADYLDTETAKIDNLIAMQERLLKLLEEKRRATIIHAVTRSLDPTVELKETGIPWLGKIPAHWELRKLKTTILSKKNGVWGGDPDGGIDDISCIRVADFDRSGLRVNTSRFTKRSIQQKDRVGRLLQSGDLLFEKSGGGDNQLVGQVVLYDIEELAVTSNFVSRLTVTRGHEPSFLVYLHAALYYQRVNYRSIKQTSGIQNIDSTAYFNELVGIPDLKEQKKIAHYILRELSKLDELKQKIQTQISLLRERRISLISHTVTGKIKI